MLAGVSGRGCSTGPRTPRFRQTGWKGLASTTRRLVRALGHGFPHLRLAGSERQHEIGLAVVEEIGRLAGTILGIDGHDADAQRIERELVQDVLGAVLEQRRDAVAEAIARICVGGRQLGGAPAGLAIGDLEARGQIAARRARRDGEEGVAGMRRDRGGKDSADGRGVHDFAHGSPPVNHAPRQFPASPRCHVLFATSRPWDG